jgi:hypothetical protein
MGAIEFKLAIVAVLAALGIYAPLPDVLGGLLLGLGASYGAMLVTPPKDRTTLWATLFVGLVVCLATAIAHPHLPFGMAELPLQLVMAAGGALSRWLGGMVAAFGKGAVERAGKLPGEIKLPGGDK